ncbi:MAG: HAD superfamily hydrolase (TIGR01459 family) [Pirellulaceae bacterium]
MTLLITSIKEALDDFDVAVLDQWGVLHNGSQPYPFVASAVDLLRRNGKETIVLSNSGKRSDVNLKRIADIGIPVATISKVITSGEALWEDINVGRLQLAGRTPRKIFPIAGAALDAIEWVADSVRIEIAADLDESVDAIMLMGLEDGTPHDAYDDIFEKALRFNKTLICSNPDKSSVRAGGLVISPGALADRYAEMGGNVIWYGKPHSIIFQAVSRSFPNTPPHRILMVGDSLEHDIAGAHSAGFKSAFIRGGLHAGDFAEAVNNETISRTIEDLAAQHGSGIPTYSLEFLA